MQLLSIPSLVAVEVEPLTEGKLDTIPLLNLPNLERLRLDHVPRSKATQDGNLLQSLRAPKLTSLLINSLRTKDLCSLHSDINPESLTVFHIIGADQSPKAAKAEATSLVKAMKNWDRLETLYLRLSPSTSPTFWNQFIRLISPLSRENLEANYRNHLVLPNLQRLIISRHSTPQSNKSSAISGGAVLSLVASRLASQRLLSDGQVALAASGDFLACEGAGEVSSPSQRVCEALRSLSINVPVEIELDALKWLDRNVKCHLLYLPPKVSQFEVSRKSGLLHFHI